MCSMVLFGPQAVSSHNSSLFQLEALLWVMSDLESYPLNALGNVRYVFFCNTWPVMECRKPSGLLEHFWWISQWLQGLATYTGQVGVSESFCPICFGWNIKYDFFPCLQLGVEIHLHYSAGRTPACCRHTSRPPCL
jgi:hypothetical protein